MTANTKSTSQYDFSDDDQQLANFSQLQEHLDSYRPEKHDRMLLGCEFTANINPGIQKLSELGFNRKQISKMFKMSPASFSNIRLDRFQEVSQGIEVLQQSIQNAGLIEDQVQRSEFIKNLVLVNPKSMKMSSQQWQQTIQVLKVDLEMDNQQIIALVNRYPRIISEYLFNQVKQTAKLMKLYLNIDNQKFNELFIKFPYILMVPEQQGIQNLKLLLNWGFQQQQIYDILIDNSQIITYKPTAVQVIRDTLIGKFKLNSKQFRNTILQEYKLLVMCAQNLLKPKYEVFESFKIDQYMQNYIMKTCPRVYVKSANSTFNKLKYLQKRWKVNDLQNYSELVYYLNFNYALQIRPRGEAMIKTKQIRNWIDVLELTDLEFCTEIGIDHNEFQQIKKEIPANSEQDFKKTFYSDLIKPDVWSQY